MRDTKEIYGTSRVSEVYKRLEAYRKLRKRNKKFFADGND